MFRAHGGWKLGILALVLATSCRERPERETGNGQVSPAVVASATTVDPAVLEPDEGGDGLRLVRVAREFWQATDLQFVPGHERLAAVLQKGGHGRLITLGGADRRAPSAHTARPFVEVAVRTAGELGLLGLAFAPDFAVTGRFYLHYDPQDGRRRSRIAEWRIPPERLGAELAREERVLLEVDQPEDNHNGGQLAFGPDGMLYVGLGDGGGQGDPGGHGQDLATLLGKLLRIDPRAPSGGLPYGIPTDNPFVARPGARPEIWAYGLRNPWRFSFDGRGRALVGDVGQYAWEEIDVVAAGDNLGWNVREGRHCHRPREGCPTVGFTAPVTEYGRGAGQCVTGGYVARGPACPALRGRYVFADFVQGRLWSIPAPNDGAFVEPRLHGKWPKMWVTFGQDPRGDLYVVDFGSGDIFRIECAAGVRHE